MPRAAKVSGRLPVLWRPAVGVGICSRHAKPVTFPWVGKHRWPWELVGISVENRGFMVTLLGEWWGHRVDFTINGLISSSDLPSNLGAPGRFFHQFCATKEVVELICSSLGLPCWKSKGPSKAIGDESFYHLNRLSARVWNQRFEIVHSGRLALAGTQSTLVETSLHRNC